MNKISIKGPKVTGQWILGVLFILYLMMDYRTPEPLGVLVDTVPGKVVVISIFLSLFFFSHPILGILGLFVGFELIRRSGSGSYADIFSSSGSRGSYGYSSNDGPIGLMPTERKRDSFYSATNQFPYTLEEEVVKQMTPHQRTSSILEPASYKPLLDNVHDASALK